VAPELSRFDQLFPALRASHNRLVDAVSPLSADQLTGRAYPTKWTIAQVVSHLGSGAEIFTLMVQAGLRGEPAPGRDQFQPVWDSWNAKSPEQQAHDGLERDAGFLAHLGALTEGERRDWRVELFGAVQDVSGLARMRLNEHALHTWDIVVAIDPAATLTTDATALLIDGLGALVARAGKPTDEPVNVLVVTDGPERQFVLDIDSDGARLSPAETAGDRPIIRLPAEALIRLVYGRLDPEHTPALETSIDLDRLRKAFPGF
jgi:uncharacterized protein (TIGR03083 family)